MSNSQLPIQMNSNTGSQNSSNNSQSIEQKDLQSTLPQKFDLYQWPASVEDAKLHEAANTLGKLNTCSQELMECECCGKSANKIPYDWLKVNVADAVGKEYGSAVPLLFELAKYYAACIIIIFCVNGFYSIYQYRRLCNLHSDSCIKMLGFLPIMGDDEVFKYLDSSQASVLRWLNFASYLTILASQILVDLFIDIKSQKLHSLERKDSQNIPRNSSRTLMVGGIPDGLSEERLKDTLTKAFGSDLDIRSIFFPSDYSFFHELFEKRTKMFFSSQKISANASYKEKQKHQKIKQQTADICLQMYQVFNYSIRYHGKALITLGSFREARRLKQLFQSSFYKKTYLLILELLNKTPQEPIIMMEWAPSLHEIKWENVGVGNIQKMKILVVTSFLAICAAIASGISLTFLSNHITGIYTLIFNIVIMAFYTVFLDHLALKKRGKTNSSKSFFLMSMQGFFVLVYFVLLPVLYYGFSSAQTTGDRTYSLFVMFLINSAIQFIVLWINAKHRSHLSFSKKLNSNPIEVASKFCQKDLNEQLQKPEFELEQRMVGVMQLWTYSTLHAFICPYTQIFSIVFIVLIFLRVKKILFTQYSLYAFKSLDFQRKFLKCYSIAFQFAVLFMFQVSNKTEAQTVMGALAFGILYIGYSIYSIFRSKKNKAQLEKQLLQDQQDTEVDGAYFQAYKQFQLSFHHPTLEKNIEGLIGVPNPFLKDTLQPK